MTRIAWSLPAQNDLRAIHSYVARDSRVYATRLIGRIKTAVKSLRLLPESGGRVREFDRDDIREIFVGNYRIIYQVQNKQVLILTVIHGAQSFPDVPAND